ncbi:TPA: hypothetical protein QDZ84_003452 [Shewanella algae]|uniref:hypothetical protein n=1 Tax=Shewanella algae TaxID=38313 RepID=UPI001C58397A|nr:hypothetical protein [Shewanella algae]HDS1208413.1 hypothetical protein [Shewanella algae]
MVKQISYDELVAQLKDKGLSVVSGLMRLHAGLNLGHTVTVHGEDGEVSIRLLDGNVDVVNAETVSKPQ